MKLRLRNLVSLDFGQMYAAGGEFTENIDATGGTGTAEFAGKAIATYCLKRHN